MTQALRLCTSYMAPYVSWHGAIIHHFLSKLQCCFISSLIFIYPHLSPPCPAPGPGKSSCLSPPLLPLQDDMHRVIDRQLMDTHLKEQSRPAAAFPRGHGVGRGQEPNTTDGKRLFSFFRKI